MNLTEMKFQTDSFYRAVDLHTDINDQPYNRIEFKIFYPAKQIPLHDGKLLPDTRFAPYPVVIFLPQTNCNINQYEWLAKEIATNGFVFVMPIWWRKLGPGRIALVPGVDELALNPETYGEIPSASAINHIVEALYRSQKDSDIAGLIDLKQIIFGGHSVGGAIALMNANQKLFGAVRAAFAWCPQSVLVGTLGAFPPDKTPPLLADVPILMLGATHDGLGDHYNHILGITDRTSSQILEKSFNDSFTAETHDKYFAILKDSNNYTICDPLDETEGFVYLDTEVETDLTPVRHLVKELIIHFLNAYVMQDETSLDTLHYLIATDQLIESHGYK